MHEGGNDMCAFKVAGRSVIYVGTYTERKALQVVVRPEDVRRYCRGEVAAELVFVRTGPPISHTFMSTSIRINTQLVRNIYHPLRMRVPKVTFMRQSKMDLGLVERILDFVGEDTCREARDDLLHA